MKTIYARTLNPELFDYRVYDIREYDYNEVIIDGGRDFCNIDTENYLKMIKDLINNYGSWDYEYYHNNSIMDFLSYYLPNKENKKRLSPRQAHDIQVTLDLYEKSKLEKSDVICKCLSVVTGLSYHMKGLCGCCQGDYVEAYYPIRKGIEKYLDYVEAWFFGTGTEIEIHDDKKTPECAEDVCGWTFYTSSWKTEDLKTEIREQCGASDDVEVSLWLYKDTRTIKIDQYELAS